MDIAKAIQPMTTFRDHSAEFMRHLRETRRPLILTVNGSFTRSMGRPVS